MFLYVCIEGTTSGNYVDSAHLWRRMHLSAAGEILLDAIPESVGTTSSSSFSFLASFLGTRNEFV